MMRISDTWQIVLVGALVMAGSAWCCCTPTQAVAGQIAAASHGESSHSHHSDTDPESSDVPGPGQSDQHPAQNQCEIVLDATGLAGGPISFIGGLQFQNLSALNQSVNPMDEVACNASRRRVDKSPPGAFGGDSLRALSCLLTV